MESPNRVRQGGTAFNVFADVGLGISRTYGRFLGIAGRVLCLFSYGCHICCVSILLETLVFPINLYVHNNVKDVESGAAKADPAKASVRADMKI